MKHEKASLIFLRLLMKSFLLGCLFTVCCFFVGAWAILKLGVYPINADAEAFWLEKKVAKMAIHSHLNKQTKDLKNPFSATPEVLNEGMKSFKSNCAGCHGSPTHVDATFADSLFPKAPQFGHKGLNDSSAEIFWLTKHGIRMSGMPAFGSMLSDDEIWKLATFIGNIEKLPEGVRAEWVAPNG
jgi:mono/diheme cytochrome c family protein